MQIDFDADKDVLDDIVRERLDEFMRTHKFENYTDVIYWLISEEDDYDSMM